MRTSTSGLRQTGSLIAGALIGFSMVGTVFAMTEAPGYLPILLAFGSLTVFVVGLVLQISMTVTPKQQPSKDAADMRTANAPGLQISESVAT